MKLSELAKRDTGTIEKLVPYEHGISFRLCFLSPAQLQKLVDESTVREFDSTVKARVQRVKQELLLPKLVQRCVKGWEGVTPDSLSNIYPDLDISKLTPEQMKAPIEYEGEAMEAVVKNSYQLGMWLNSVVTDVSVFRPDQADELKNSETSQAGA